MYGDAVLTNSIGVGQKTGSRTSCTDSIVGIRHCRSLAASRTQRATADAAVHVGAARERISGTCKPVMIYVRGIESRSRRCKS
jgi:hypothetical protein